MKNENLPDDAFEVLGAILLSFGLLIAMAWISFGAEPRMMRAQPAPNGGLASSAVTPDGKYVILKWNDGTVATNALRRANTPPEDRAQIESEFRKAVIVSAALAEVVAGDPADKLQLAAERASESLRSRSAGTLEPVGGDKPPLERELEIPVTPPTREPESPTRKE